MKLVYILGILMFGTVMALPVTILVDSCQSTQYQSVQVAVHTQKFVAETEWNIPEYVVWNTKGQRFTCIKGEGFNLLKPGYTCNVTVQAKYPRRIAAVYNCWKTRQ